MFLKHSLSTLLIAVIFVVTACGKTPEEAYADAINTGSVSSLQAFISDYPESELVNGAQKALDELIFKILSQDKYKEELSNLDLLLAGTKSLMSSLMSAMLEVANSESEEEIDEVIAKNKYSDLSAMVLMEETSKTWKALHKMLDEDLDDAGYTVADDDKVITSTYIEKLIRRYINR